MMRQAGLAAALLVASTVAGAPGQDVSREITCYSGGREILHAWSDPAGPVYLGAQDDHVLFRDRDTHRLTRVGGDCIVSWAAPAR